MLTRVLLLFPASVALTLAAECFYKAAQIPGTNYVELKSMSCDHGCCGTVDEQECCEGLNWWMVFAFILVGIFLIFVIITAVYLIIKKKNKKKEQVGNLSNTQAFEDQPSTVDLSVFRTENSRTAHPPPYSFVHNTTSERRPKPTVPSVPNRYLQNEHTTIERRPNPMEDFAQDRYLMNAGSTASWRDSDLAYFDRYLENSKNTENERWNSPVDYSALHHTGDTMSSSKLDAEFEQPQPYEHPDFTAETVYLGNTTERTPESPTAEDNGHAQFSFMAANN